MTQHRKVSLFVSFFCALTWPQIELPPSARTGSHIRRVSATISLKEQLASLASQGFMPAGDVALFRESSGTPPWWS